MLKSINCLDNLEWLTNAVHTEQILSSYLILLYNNNTYSYHLSDDDVVMFLLLAIIIFGSWLQNANERLAKKQKCPIERYYSNQSEWTLLLLLNHLRIVTETEPNALSTKFPPVRISGPVVVSFFQ